MNLADLTKISPEFAKDLIELVNDLGELQKTAAVSYGATRFHYVPLDDMLARIKQNHNFALLQPLGVMQDGRPCIKCLLIHKSGEILSSDSYPLRIKEGAKKQDEGAEITYSRRYCLASFLSIASDEDTDANNEGNPTREARPTLPRREQQTQQQQPPITKETGEEINRLIKKYRALSDDASAIKRMEAKFGKAATTFTENDGQNAILLLNSWIKRIETTRQKQGA